MSFNSLVITGTTAVGKTRLAAALAKKWHGAVLSVDSRQVYVGMNLGTGKDLLEYVVDGVQVPYFLIDTLPAGEKYDVHHFQMDFYKAWTEVADKGLVPILCGGTMLYLASILQDYSFTQVPVNSEFRELLALESKQTLLDKLNTYAQVPFKVDADSTKRIIRALEILNYLENHNFHAVDKPVTLNAKVFALALPNDIRRTWIAKRLLRRIEEGMVEEVQHLLNNGLTEAQLKYYGLEYKYTVNLLNGSLSHTDYLLQLEAAIYRFSKQQTLFLRKMEREGVAIHWVDAQIPLQEQIEIVEHHWAQ